MVTHFFYDITHFDSNFFHTIHHLILKPGFLTKEYMMGRRASYLHPIKMYVFTSAIFFLLFFSVFSPKIDFDTPDEILSSQERTAYIEKLTKLYKKDTTDRLAFRKLNEAKDTAFPVKRRDRYQFPDDDIITLGGRQYANLDEYDSIQSSLPKKEQDNWFEKRVIRKIIQVNVKYRQNPEEAEKNLVNSLLHRLPYMLFVSLPLFAFILWMVYIRRRKRFYFADHGVFTIHLYVFSFILLLVLFSLSSLQEATNWKFLNFVAPVLILFLFVYLFIAMRKFYGQNWGKTFLKFLLVSLFSFIMMAVLFILFLLFSAFTL